MAANILERDIQVGTSMAWHKKTKIVDSIDRSNCGIIYPMRKEQLILQNGKATEHYSIVSDDDGMAIGNPVKKGYKLISNEQMIDMVEDSLKGTQHDIVSVGSIGNREKVFCSIKISDNFVAGGRDTENVVNVLWGHGGVFGVVARSGFTVIVCANTFAMALGRKGKELDLQTKHTGNANLKIENMGKAIESHYGVAAEFQKAMNEFSTMALSKSEAKQAIAGFIVRDTLDLSEVSSRTSNTIDRIHQLFNGGAGNKGETRCDLFNAFTDFYSHESSGGENRWKQFESSEFGAGHKAKTEAFQLIRGDDVPKLGTWNEAIKRGDKVLQLA
jgi:hypothetical protein